MSANRLFLVCSAHPAIEDAFCLGERATASSVYELTASKSADKWLAKHAHCGVDHFALAYHRPKGWDVSPPAQDTIAGRVRFAIATGETIPSEALELIGKTNPMLNGSDTEH